MAGAMPDSGGDGGGETSKGRSSPGVWRVLGLLLIVVVGGAAASFAWKSGALTRELNDQYARTIARYGRELELRHDNYRKVVDNLTQVAGAARARFQGAEARAYAVRSVRESLDARVRAHDLIVGQAKQQLAIAKQQLTREAPKLVNEADQNVDRAVDTMDAAFRNDAVANAKVTAAKNALDAAQKTAESASKSQAAAQRAIKSAAAAVSGPSRAAAQHTDDARQASSVAHSAADAATSAVAQASAALAEAEAAQARTSSGLVVASRALLKALDDAANVADRSSAKWAALHALTRSQGQISEDLAALIANQTSVVTELRLVETSDDAELIKYASALSKVLPSYSGVVARCFQLAAEANAAEKNTLSDANVDLCIAQGVVAANEGYEDSLHQGLNVVACEQNARWGPATLSADESALSFAPPASGNALAACGRVSLNRLLADLTDASVSQQRVPARSFDQVLLLDGKGKVLTATAPGSALRVISLPHFTDKLALASQVLPEVELGSRKYSVYLQPIAVAIARSCPKGDGCTGEDAKPVRLLLAGLVNNDRLFSERLEVTPGTFLWAIILLGLVVLALPLAKLWLLGPTSRLRQFDVALLASSAAAATLLTILLTLAATSYFKLRSDVDRDLDAVGSNLRDKFQGRRDDASRLLGHYVESTTALRASFSEGQTEDDTAFRAACNAPFQKTVGQPLATTCQGAGVLDDVLFEAEHATLSACEQVHCNLDGAGARPAGWVHAFLADDAGRQRVKSAAGRHAPVPISVAGRGYFQRAMAKRCQSPGDCGAHEVTEVVRSSTTGELLLVVAQPFWRTNAGDSAKPDGVAGITLALPEFQKPALPLGFQTAIIDADGQVMIHSKNSAFQGQNLFDDIDDVPALRAAIDAGETHLVSLNYRGQRSRARVERLKNSTWSVLTIAPSSLVDLVLSRSVAITLVGYGILLGLGLLLFAGLVVLARWQRVRDGAADLQPVLSLKPRADSRREYANAARFMLLGLVPPLLAALFPFGFLPMVMLLACAFVAVGALMRAPGIGRGGLLESLRPAAIKRPDPVRPIPTGAWMALESAGRASLRRWFGEERCDASPTRLTLAQAFAACCFALGAVLVSAPACVLFAAATDHMEECMARAQQHHLASHVAPLSCLVDPHASGCGHVYRPASALSTPPRRTPVSAAGRTAPQPPKPALDAVVEQATQSVFDRGPLVQALLGWLPDFELAGGSNAALLVLAQAPPEPPGIDWRWHRNTTELSLEPGQRAAPIASLVTPLPTLAQAIAATYGWPFLLLLVFGVCSYGLSLRVFKRLFHMRLLTELGHHSIDELVETMSAGKRCYVPNATVRDLLPVIERFELESLAAVLAEEATDPDVPLLFELDAAVGPKIAKDMLALVEAAPLLVVVCDTDPLEDSPELEQLSWAQALRDFEVARLPAAPHPDLAGKATPKRVSLQALLAACDDDERRVLAQLALDGYANPHPNNSLVLERLARKGLVDANSLSVARPSFAQYIRSALSATEVARWEESERGGSWSAMRGVLFAALATLTAIVTAIQPSFAAASASVPALAVAVPTAIRLLAAFAGGETQK
jgi:hypothetical protein